MAEPAAKEEPKKGGKVAPTKKGVSVKEIGICQDKNARHRRTMEDAHVDIDNFGGKEGEGYFAIYDGHGGRGAVDFVAEHLHENFLEALKANPDDISAAWKESYKKTDDMIGEAKILYSGTTTVTAYIREHEGKRWLHCANAGDARIVLVRGGEALRLTKEHKGSDEEEAKRIQEAGGFIVLNRVNGILAVTRSLGDYAMKEYVTGEPYTQDEQLTDADTHLILACDGLWDVCTDQGAADLIKDLPDAGTMATELLKYALRNGSTDNVSVMVLVL